MDYNESLQPDAGTAIMTSGNSELIDLFQNFKKEIWDRKGNPIFTESHFDKVIKAGKNTWYLLSCSNPIFANFLAVPDMNSPIVRMVGDEEEFICSVKYKRYFRSTTYSSGDAKTLKTYYEKGEKEKFQEKLFYLLGDSNIKKRSERGDEVKLINLFTEYLSEKSLLTLLEHLSEPYAQVVIVESDLDLSSVLNKNEFVTIKVPRYNSNKEARDRVVDAWRAGLKNKAKFSSEDYIISAIDLENEDNSSVLSYEEKIEMDEDLIERYEAQEQARSAVESKYRDSDDVSINGLEDYINYRNFKSFSLDDIILNALKKENMMKYFSESELPIARKLLLASIKLYNLDNSFLNKKVKRVFDYILKVKINPEMFEVYRDKVSKHKKGWDSQVLIKYVLNRSRLKDESYIVLDIYRNKLRKLLNINF